MQTTVVIPAAGSGSRYGSQIPKQYLLLHGRPVIAHVIDRFFRAGDLVAEIIVCVAADQLALMQEIAEHNRWGNVRLIAGGETRLQSVANGVRAAAKRGGELVAVHDAVRPFFRLSTLRKLLDAATERGGAVPALPVIETLHRIRDGVVAETPDRSEWVAAQTPQCFRLSLLNDVLQRAIDENRAATDEAGLVAQSGHEVVFVEGDPHNIKITRPEDLYSAEANFDRWSAEE